jgi:hypothetical protein
VVTVQSRFGQKTQKITKAKRAAVWLKCLPGMQKSLNLIPNTKKNQNHNNKDPTKLTHVLGYSSFSPTNMSWIVSSLWLISRVLKELVLIIFFSVLIALMEEWI